MTQAAASTRYAEHYARVCCAMQHGNDPAKDVENARGAGCAI